MQEKWTLFVSVLDLECESRINLFQRYIMAPPFTYRVKIYKVQILYSDSEFRVLGFLAPVVYCKFCISVNL